MYNAIFLAFALLFIKHWYVDFVNQDMEEVNHKGLYMHWLGIKHSLKQGIATMAVFVLVGVDVPSAYILGAIDFAIHYHVDYIKMNYGNRDITTPAFWNHLGLDQLAHYMTYLGLVWLVAGR